MSIFTSIAVSPSGTTLLNALQVTTAAGVVLNEGVTLVDSANPANVGSILASGAMLVEPGGVNSQPVTGTVTAVQATPANLKTLSEVWDGTNTAAVKASGVPPLTTDPAIVVALSPNIGARIVGNIGSSLDATVAAGTPPVNGLAILGQYNSSVPTQTNAQTMALQQDAWGDLVTRPFRRTKTLATATTITNSSAATTVMAAQGATNFADICTLVITTVPGAAASTAFTATFSDGTASYIFDGQTGAVATAPQPGTFIDVSFNPPLPATTANVAWTVALSVATITAHIMVHAIQTKAM